MNEIPLSAIHPLLKFVREQLDRAVVIVMQAEASADSGKTDKAVSTMMDIEPLIYEINTFINAASLINRVADS